MKIRNYFLYFIVIISMCLILTSCEKEKTYTKTNEVSMIAVGDNLIHDCIIYGGMKNGEINYDEIFENVKYKIEEYDLAVINQETILVNNAYDYTGYPRFGTPTKMADAIVNAGFDIVLHATNHTRDKGIEAINTTLNYWKNNFPDIKVLGIHDTKEDYDEIKYIEKNNIKLALFNATYGLNGFALPRDKYYLVNLLDDKDKMINDIKISSDNSDMQIAFLHIGTEYVFEPTNFQKEYVNDLIDAGCDIVVCSHPHVIEPYGMITTPNGNSGLVYYSCGNFMGHQDNIKMFLGGAASFTIEKDVTYDVETNEEISCEIKIKEYDFLPLIIHTRGNKHTTYFLEDYRDELAKEHSLRIIGQKFSLEEIYNLWDSVIHDDRKNNYELYKKIKEEYVEMFK